ncbi:hypothetical protein [Pseudarthrobacter sulfonivorans]|uniref:hypothetical protein n=1 Tax=Pseudarthrobacter sulfonivorans TaxID=121292 RepID=UPI0009FB1070|nr:hypothetical protein [Pseudarthrobacter sulfonivorans]
MQALPCIEADSAAAEHRRKDGAGKSQPPTRGSSAPRDLKARGLTPADIGKIVGASRTTLYRYLGLARDELV